MVDCATIRDLLPLYVDDVLSVESKALISGHLATCESCKEEYNKMQSEFVKLPTNVGAKFDVLKSMKKKFFRQKVIVGVTACAVAIAVAIAGFYYVYHHDTPIEYEEGLIRVQKGTAESLMPDGTTADVAVLDLIRTQNHYGSYGASRVITVDGEDIDVQYFYLSSTLSTRTWRQNNAEPFFRRHVGIGINMSHGTDPVNNPPLPLEIYYLVMPFEKTIGMSDEDFYELRNDGVLLFSGHI
ncbi:MAG: zf-HC2 domain-containing protein [Oscillospiraceae bacterium]|nr:zf-HC2 domain-containing protein [Oscillospiraceae bacterium]